MAESLLGIKRILRAGYIQNMKISGPFIKRYSVPKYSGIFNGIIDLCMTGLTPKDRNLTTEIIVIREHLPAKDNYYKEVLLTIQRNALAAAPLHCAVFFQDFCN